MAEHEETDSRLILCFIHVHMKMIVVSVRDTDVLLLLIAGGRLRGLAVACWTTDHYHPCSNPGVGISEGCFVFHFVSLPLEVGRPI